MFRRSTVNIGVKRFEAGALDAHNNPKRVWAEPTPTPVWLVAPSQREEPATQERPYTVQTVWDIYAPPDTEIGPYDRVILPDGTICEVIGDIARWNHNPYQTGIPQRCVQFTVKHYQG